MSELCQFERLEDGFLVCRICGLRAPKIASNPVAVCRPRRKPVADDTGVPLLERAANFAASAFRHVAAGAPRCTDEQIAERHAICVGCEHYDGKACRKCGCPVVRKYQWVSKLSWAGESCPVGKWGPIQPSPGAPGPVDSQG